MSEVPNDLKYTATHEWVRLEEDGTVTVGITDHAQDLLGDLVFVELPDVEAEIHLGEECGVVESVKAASDIYAPISGEIIEVNEALSVAPNAVNNDPYGDGWLFRLKPTNEAEMEHLLDNASYEEQVSTEEE